MTATETKTLQQMRNAKGLKAREVAPLLAAKLGRDQIHVTTILKHEADGVRDHFIMEAYAEIYGVSIDDVVEANRHS